MKLATNFKDFPALTAIFKDFQGLKFLFWDSRTFKALNFYFEIQGLSRPWIFIWDSRTFKDFQGLEFLFWDSRPFKDFQGLEVLFWDSRTFKARANPEWSSEWSSFPLQTHRKLGLAVSILIRKYYGFTCTSTIKQYSIQKFSYSSVTYLRNKPQFLCVYRCNKPGGMLGEHEKSLKVTSCRQVIYNPFDINVVYHYLFKHSSLHLFHLCLCS